MPSAVDISNIALVNIGAESLVTSIDPPDGSAEAGYCATFWPVARRAALELANPGFARKRATLAETTNGSEVWSYAYAKPSDCLRPLRVLSATTLTALLTGTDSTMDFILPDERDSADFTVEGSVIYTNEPEAVLIYTWDQTDPTKYTPLFTVALGQLLSSYLAGPIIKGREGAGIAAQWAQMGTNTLVSAAVLEANATSERNDQVPAALRARA